MRSRIIALVLTAASCQIGTFAQNKNLIGKEISVPRHLRDGDEYTTPIKDLVAFGQKLLGAIWTPQEGGGRPFTKGTGAELTDVFSPLMGPRSFNRISAPDANSCAGCHSQPFGIIGGGGDIVANVFVLGQRFDFATFDGTDTLAIRGGRDESGRAVTQNTVGNARAKRLVSLGLATRVTWAPRAIRSGRQVANNNSSPMPCSRQTRIRRPAIGSPCQRGNGYALTSASESPDRNRQA